MVTRHGKPIARIVPAAADDSEKSVWDTVAESRARYGELTDDVELPPRDIPSNRPDPLG